MLSFISSERGARLVLFRSNFMTLSKPLFLALSFFHLKSKVSAKSTRRNIFTIIKKLPWRERQSEKRSFNNFIVIPIETTVLSHILSLVVAFQSLLSLLFYTFWDKKIWAWNAINSQFLAKTATKGERK